MLPHFFAAERLSPSARERVPRRPNTYMMVVAIVALSLKVHRVYFRHDPDPWLLRPTHFARRFRQPRRSIPARPAPDIGRPEPRKRYSA
jgi:hypothetical protein